MVKTIKYLAAFSIALTTTAGVVTSPADAAPKGQPVAAQPNPEALQLNEKGGDAIKAKNYVVAEDLFRRAVTIDPANLSAVYNLAGMYLLNKKTDAAISLLSDYTAKKVGDPGIYVRLGDAYFAGKKIKEAGKNYELAFAIAPQYDGLVNKLATVYTMQKNLPAAEKMLRAAIEQEPKNPNNLASLAALLLAKGASQEAIETAKRSLQVRATSGAYVTLGAAYESVKDAKNALTAFEKAADLGDSRPELQSKIESLKNG